LGPLLLLLRRLKLLQVLLDVLFCCSFGGRLGDRRRAELKFLNSDGLKLHSVINYQTIARRSPAALR